MATGPRKKKRGGKRGESFLFPKKTEFPGKNLVCGGGGSPEEVERVEAGGEKGGRLVTGWGKGKVALNEASDSGGP